MEEPGAGYCPWGRKELDTTERLHLLTYTRTDEVMLPLTSTPPTLVF